MFGSTVLEVAIGLACCYGTLALVVTTLQEALAATFRLRAGMLLDAVKRMLNDPRFDGAARALYAHPLVNPRAGPDADPDRRLDTRPSYIEPANFALALVDALHGSGGGNSGDSSSNGGGSLEADIAAVPDPQLRRTLQTLYQQAGGDAQRFQLALAGWFDAAMERLSGVYKRRQLLVSFLLSLLLVILLNIDSIHLFQTLWQQPALAAQIMAAPGGLDAAAIDQLWALPIGWQVFPPALDAAFALQAAGWLISASTALFGAPFWFDILQRAINLRSTGAKPAPWQGQPATGAVTASITAIPAAAVSATVPAAASPPASPVRPAAGAAVVVVAPDIPAHIPGR